jgi:Family of unknown function (DUF6326)
MPLLEDFKVHVRLKLSALWASTMACYIYCDYFELYVPGKLRGMQQGNIEPLGPITQGMLVGMSLMMIVPSLMIFLSLVLRPSACRWANIVIALCYTLLLCMLAYEATWYFYKLFAVIEAGLTALIVMYAWKWPRTRDAEPA